MQDWPHDQTSSAAAATAFDVSRDESASAQRTAPPQFRYPKWFGQLASPQDSIDVREVLSRGSEMGKQAHAAGALAGDEVSAPHQRRQPATPSRGPALANILPGPKQKGDAAKVCVRARTRMHARTHAKSVIVHVAGHLPLEPVEHVRWCQIDSLLEVLAAR